MPSSNSLLLSSKRKNKENVRTAVTLHFTFHTNISQMLHISPVSICIILGPQNMRSHSRFRASAFEMLLKIKSSGMLRHVEKFGLPTFRRINSAIIFRVEQSWKSKAGVAPASKASVTGCRNHEIRGSMNSNGITYIWSFMKIDWQVKLKYACTHALTRARTQRQAAWWSHQHTSFLLHKGQYVTNSTNSMVLIAECSIPSSASRKRINTQCLSEFVRALGINTWKWEYKNDGKELNCLLLRIRVPSKVENKLHTLSIELRQHILSPIENSWSTGIRHTTRQNQTWWKK
jgi:hypothetical protein